MDCITHALTRSPELPGRVIGGLVVSGDQIPHAVLDKDVGRHMPGVGYRRRDLGIAIRGFESEGCMNGVVE